MYHYLNSMYCFRKYPYTPTEVFWVWPPLPPWHTHTLLKFQWSFILATFWPFRPLSHSELQMTCAGGRGRGVFVGEYGIFWTAQCVVSMVKGGVTTLTFCSVQKQLCPVAWLYSFSWYFLMNLVNVNVCLPIDTLRAEPLSILRIERGSAHGVAHWAIKPEKTKSKISFFKFCNLALTTLNLG